jgi:hypothetical protein
MIMTTAELAAARLEERLTPDLQFAVQRDARGEQAVASYGTGAGR